MQVTSLPFVYAGLPLYKAAGTAGILLLPIAGSLLAAYAARRLALALGASTGWWAFWLVGVGTPMLFYAGDFWEHSMGVGLMLLKSLGQFVGLADDLLCRSGHHPHLKYLGRASIACTMTGPSVASTTPISSNLPALSVRRTSKSPSSTSSTRMVWLYA